MSEVDPKPLKLTLRRAALLHCIRFGGPPWTAEPNPYVQNAIEVSPDRWILCCGHVYSGQEIKAMVAAGWISIDTRDARGRRTTTAGPKILDAWQWPHY